MKALLAVVALVMLCACSDGRDAAAWIAAQAQANAAADEALERDDLKRAKAALQAALTPAPDGVAAADARALKADMLYRLATLALQDYEPAEAKRLADEGLALGDDADVFTANLLVVRGRANQSLGDARAAGDDYHRALIINEALLEEHFQNGAE